MSVFITSLLLLLQECSCTKYLGKKKPIKLCIAENHQSSSKWSGDWSMCGFGRTTRKWLTHVKSVKSPKITAVLIKMQKRQAPLANGRAGEEFFSSFCPPLRVHTFFGTHLQSFAIDLILRSFCLYDFADPRIQPFGTWSRLLSRHIEQGETDSHHYRTCLLHE